MFIQETYVNRDENCIFSETDPYVPFSENKGQLFRSLQKEYGACIGKMYIDQSDGHTVSIGWIFAKKMSYEDCPSEFYTREVWVTLLESKPVTTKHYEYHTL